MDECPFLWTGCARLAGALLALFMAGVVCAESVAEIAPEVERRLKDRVPDTHLVPYAEFGAKTAEIIVNGKAEGPLSKKAMDRIVRSVVEFAVASDTKLRQKSATEVKSTLEKALEDLKPVLSNITLDMLNRDWEGDVRNLSKNVGRLKALFSMILAERPVMVLDVRLTGAASSMLDLFSEASFGVADASGHKREGMFSEVVRGFVATAFESALDRQLQRRIRFFGSVYTMDNRWPRGELTPGDSRKIKEYLDSQYGFEGVIVFASWHEIAEMADVCERFLMGESLPEVAARKQRVAHIRQVYAMLSDLFLRHRPALPLVTRPGCPENVLNGAAFGYRSRDRTDESAVRLNTYYLGSWRTTMLYRMISPSLDAFQRQLADEMIKSWENKVTQLHGYGGEKTAQEVQFTEIEQRMYTLMESAKKLPIGVEGQPFMHLVEKHVKGTGSAFEKLYSFVTSNPSEDFSRKHLELVKELTDEATRIGNAEATSKKGQAWYVYNRADNISWFVDRDFRNSSDEIGRSESNDAMRFMFNSLKEFRDEGYLAMDDADDPEAAKLPELKRSFLRYLLVAKKSNPAFGNLRKLMTAQEVSDLYEAHKKKGMPPEEKEAYDNLLQQLFERFKKSARSDDESEDLKKPVPRPRY